MQTCLESETTLMTGKMAGKKTSGQATILQVAAHCGLSIATVSRVLNGGKYVSGITRQKVLEAAKALNYQPNYMARQLHGQDAFSVGVILGMEIGSISPYALKVYESLKRYLEERGYRARRVKFGPDNKVLTEARAYISIGVHDSDERLVNLRSSDAPIIYIGEPKEESFWVASNDEHGGMLATKHLLDNGCRNIYFVSLDVGHKVSHLRALGYRRAMLEAGLIPAEVINVPSNSGLSALDSYRRIRPMLESGLKPDGFVAFSDIVASGICMAITDYGKLVPEHIQVVGYDGIDNELYHSLTSVCQNTDAIAEKACDLVIDAIRKNKPRGEFLDVRIRQGHTTRVSRTV